MVYSTSPSQRKERTKTRFGVKKRIIRMMQSVFAVCIDDVAKRFNFSYRHARLYLVWLEDEGLIYRRYKHQRRHYFSIVRRNNANRESR